MIFQSGLRVLLLLLSILLTFCTASPADTTVSGRISSDTTWTLAGSPYIVTSTVQVYGTTTSPVTLTIEPGVVVKYYSGAGLQIGSGANQGALIAQGTSANHITFTRNGTSGTWSTLYFQDGTVDGTTILEYIDVQYNTGVMMASSSPTIKNTTITNLTGYLNLNNSNPVLENTTISNSGTYGIYLLSSSPTITGGSLTNTSATGQGIYGSGSPAISNYSVSIVNSTGKYGFYSTSSTSALSITNSNISNGLYINSTGITPTVTGNTITNVDNSPVHAGANIIAGILSNNTINGMTSAGKIEVEGEQINQDTRWLKWNAPYVVTTGTVSVYKDSTTPSTLTIDPGVTIKFASSSGLTVGSSTSQGALIAQGTAGDRITLTRSGGSGTWTGMTFNDKTVDATTILENVDIQYAATGMVMNTASPTITNSTISNSGTHGIYLSSSSPVITGGSLTNTGATGHGIYGSGSPVISNYNISITNTAGKYGLYLPPRPCPSQTPPLPTAST